MCRPMFWFLILLVPVAAMLIDVTAKVYWSIAHPSPNLVLREIEQIISKRTVNDCTCVQRAWCSTVQCKAKQGTCTDIGCR